MLVGKQCSGVTRLTISYKLYYIYNFCVCDCLLAFSVQVIDDIRNPWKLFLVITGSGGTYVVFFVLIGTCHYLIFVSVVCIRTNLHRSVEAYIYTHRSTPASLIVPVKLMQIACLRCFRSIQYILFQKHFHLDLQLKTLASFQCDLFLTVTFQVDISLCFQFLGVMLFYMFVIFSLE